MIGGPREEYQVSDQIEEKLIAILAKKKKLDPTTITLDSTFEALGMDSLDAADLLFTVEDDFAIVVPDDAALAMRTVGQVVDGIRQLQAARPAAPADPPGAS